MLKAGRENFDYRKKWFGDIRATKFFCFVLVVGGLGLLRFDRT